MRPSPSVLDRDPAPARIESMDDRQRVDAFVRQVLAGEVRCPGPVAYALFVRLADVALAERRRQASASLDLTLRQLQIVRLVAQGLSTDEVAARLFVSPGTVKTHVHLVLRKLKVANRQQAVMHAEQRGWLDVCR